MTPQIAYAFVLVVIAVFLMARETLGVDVVALAVVVALVIPGILTPREAFAGFASDVTFVLASVFILSGTIVQSGLMARVGQWLAGSLGSNEGLMVGVIMSVTAVLSAFVSNTNSTAVLMPAVAEAARRSNRSPSRLLLPLAFASMLGGSATLIGTSTNLAASGLIESLGMRPLGMFELLPAVALVTLGGILYMAIVGRRWLPEHASGALEDDFQIEAYVAEVRIVEERGWTPKTLAEWDLADHGVRVLAIRHKDGSVLPMARTRIEEGDRLIVRGPRDALLNLIDITALEFTMAPDTRELPDDVVSGLAEAVVLPRSRFIGRTARQLELARYAGLALLAVYRRGHASTVETGDMVIEAGDVLLLQGEEERIADLNRSGSAWVVGTLGDFRGGRRRGLLAATAMLFAVVAVTFGWLPLSVAMLVGTLALVAFGGVSTESAYRMIDWRAIVLIGGMTSLGVAIEKTGAAQYLADLVALSAPTIGTGGVLLGLVVVTMALTQPLSNAAAALVMLPVATATAGALGLDARALAILVTLAASLSFIAPLEPACLLVYGPGRYRFADFLRAGIPMTLVSIVLLLALVPRLWPLS